jgi:hypothetical protein
MFQIFSFLSSRLKLLPERAKLNFFFIKSKKKVFADSFYNFSIVVKSRIWTSNKVKQFDTTSGFFSIVKSLFKWTIICFVLYYKQESIIHYFRDVLPYELYFSVDLYRQVLDVLCDTLVVLFIVAYFIICSPLIFFFPNFKNYQLPNPPAPLHEIPKYIYKSNFIGTLGNSNHDTLLNKPDTYKICWSTIAKKLNKINNKNKFKKNSLISHNEEFSPYSYNLRNTLSSSYETKYTSMTPKFFYKSNLLNFKWLNFFSSIPNKYFLNILSNNEVLKYSKLSITRSNTYLWELAKLNHFNTISRYVIKNFYYKIKLLRGSEFKYDKSIPSTKYKILLKSINKDLLNLNTNKGKYYKKTFFIKK